MIPTPQAIKNAARAVRKQQFERTRRLNCCDPDIPPTENELADATAAITSYLSQMEKEGFVMMRGAGSRHDNYIGLLRSLAECGGAVKLPHPIIRGYGPGYLERHGYAQWLRDSPRTASATGFAITEEGRAMLAAAEDSNDQG